METEALRWFQLVAEGMTVTEVADEHRVSQPGVSRALARLEAEVGTPLLQRSGRLLRPTYAGTVFKRHVDAVLHGLEDGMSAVSELADPRTGSVSVSFQLSLGTWLVPDLIQGFRAEYPDVRFRLEQSHDALGSTLVAGGRIDLEFTARRPHNPAVRWERLLAQPLALAVPRRHRLARRGDVSLADAAEEDFVTYRPAWALRSLIDDLCKEAGFAPRVAFEADDVSVVQGFVAAGLGVGVVPMAVGEPHTIGPTLRLLRLTDPHASREVGLAWSGERRLLPSAELFLKHVLGTRAD
jgi:DNA-binding transcriptional LysR family regulator